MKLRLMCLFVLSIFVFSACSSEAVKESGSASDSVSEPTDISENDDLYREYIISNPSRLTDYDIPDEIPKESVMIIVDADKEWDYGIEKLTISNAEGKKLYFEERSSDELVMKTNMKVFWFGGCGEFPLTGSKQRFECYVEPSESFTVEGKGGIIIDFPGDYPPAGGLVSEKIVVTCDTITLYGADKENPVFKDKERVDGKKVIFAE